MTRRFAILQVDVFTETPLAGNPLAVVPAAEGLSDGEMQSIARETNLSETAFVLPAGDPAADYGVQGIPATFVIRADGIVHTQHIGVDPEYVATLKTDITGAIEALEAAP